MLLIECKKFIRDILRTSRFGSAEYGETCGKLSKHKSSAAASNGGVGCVMTRMISFVVASEFFSRYNFTFCI